MGGDDHPLDLVGTLVDGGDLGIAVEPLHLHALQIAVAAEDLQGIVGDFQGDIRGVLLRHGGFHAVGGVLLFQISGAVYQQPGGPEFGCHVGDLEGNSLLLADAAAELDALLGILYRRFKGTLSDAQRLGRDADAAAVQGGHGDLKALALLSQQVLLGNLDIIE